jgi:chaperonin GroES
MNPDKLRPINDQILVLRDEDKTQTPGGLHIPDAFQREHKLPPGRGTVLAVGPGVVNPKTGERIPCDVAVGDFIVFSRLSGDVVSERDDSILLISEREIMLVTEPY